MDWYSVKLIYKYTITDEPNPFLVDKFFSGRTKFYEESVILVVADSFEDAYKVAESNASMEVYMNKYGQTVTMELYNTVDCFKFYEQPQALTEVYSTIFSCDVNADIESLVDKRYEKCTIEEMHMLRHK
ncbi:MAG: DUF4288 domain-containing protein [Bacillota bacterium]